LNPGEDPLSCQHSFPAGRARPTCAPGFSGFKKSIHMHRTLRALALVATAATLASCGDSASPLATSPAPPRFTTGAAFPAPPNFNIQLPPPYAQGALLTWDDVPGDQVYLVQYRVGETGTWKSLVTTGVNRTNYPATENFSLTQPNFYRVAGMTPDFQVGEFSTAMVRPGAYTDKGFLTSDTTADLNGRVRPNGTAATWWFEYGTDSTLAGATLTPPAVQGTHPSLQMNSVARTIPVVPGTLYYFRLAASNAGGTSYGPILHFTAGAPAAPAGMTATFVAQPELVSYGTYSAAHHVRIQWTHDGADVTSFRPQRRLAGSAAWVQVADLGGTVRTAVDQAFPVTSDREYDYRVLACNRLGQCSASAEQHVTTLGLPAPAGFTATRTADGKVALAWQDLPTEESYLVQWRAGDSGSWQTLVSTAQSVTAYTTASVTAGVTNDYRVAGEVKSFRDGAFSEASVAAGAGASTQVQTGGSSLPSSTSAALKGTVTPNGLATTAWIEWGTDPSLGAFSAAPAKSVGSGTAAVAFTDTVAVTSGLTYYYRAAASNSAGTVRGTIQSFYAGPPAAAVVTAAFSLASYRIQVTWTHSGVGSPTLFRLDRRATGQTAWTEVTSTVGNIFLDTSFPANAARSYDYRVRSCNAAGECTPSSTQTVQTQALAAPGAFSAQLSAVKVTLTWQDITGEVDYLVQWRTDPSAPWHTLLTTSANVNVYTTASVTPGATNYYRIAGEASGFRTGVFSETSIAVP